MRSWTRVTFWAGTQRHDRLLNPEGIGPQRCPRPMAAGDATAEVVLTTIKRRHMRKAAPSRSTIAKLVHTPMLK
jgi:hypothetical protein